MKNLLKVFVIAVVLGLAVSSCCGGGFPKLDNDGKIGIVAHRGFWQCEEACGAHNSLSSLNMAGLEGFEGSEFDVNLTRDGRVLVSHGPEVDGYNIIETDFDILADCLLEDGSKRPSLEDYLALAREYSDRTRLVLEVKPQNEPSLEDELLSQCVTLLKENDMFDPAKVMFISFSMHVCEEIAAKYPKFINQYLGGGIAPADLAAKGINGIDYHFCEFYSHPEWVEEAHGLGMSVNVWTVDSEEDLGKVIALGVDQITTNCPLLLREMLGEREWTR